MKLQGAFAALWLIWLACGIAGAQTEIDNRLAREGRSRVTVVVDEAAPSVVRMAAADLADCLGRILGAEVGLVHTVEEVATPLKIVVDAEGLDLADLKPDGYAMRTVGPALLIDGPDASGVANGVYSLLIDHAGARWFMPGELFEVLPPNPEMELPVVDVRVDPDIGYRVFSGDPSPGARWSRRNRWNSYDRSTQLPYNHNLGYIIEPAVYGESHPEYFAMIEGERRPWYGDGDPLVGAQPCFSNREVIALVVKAAQDYFDSHPSAAGFSLCPNDTDAFCTCADCAALDAPPRESPYGWPCHSDSYFHFVTEVAREVALSHPGKMLTTYAYWNTDLPPRYIDRLPDNVMVRLTQDTSQHHDPAYHVMDEQNWLAWREKTDHLGHYDYYGLGWFSGRYFPYQAAAQLKFLARNGCDDMYNAYHPNWVVTGPMVYLASRLMWDAELDPAALIDEYMQTLYGEAAGRMSEFYQTLDFYWRQPRQGIWFEGLLNFVPEMAIANEKLLDQALELLGEAEAMASGAERERVRYVRDHFGFNRQAVTTALRARQANERAYENPGNAEAVIADVIGVLTGMNQKQEIFETVWMTDPNYSHNVYFTGSHYEQKNGTWEEYTSSLAEGALRRIVFHAAEQGEDDAQALKERIEAEVYPLADERLRPLEAFAVQYECPRLGKTPEIDGKLDEWAGIAGHAFTAGRTLTGETLDRPDLNGLIWFGWDDANLYVAAAVSDPQHHQTHDDGGMWQEDCIQLTIDARPAMTREAERDANDTELGFALGPKGPVAWRWYAPEGKVAGRVDTIELRVRREDGRTLYEAAIPWSELGIVEVSDGRDLGVAAVVIDAQELERDFLEWGSGLYYTKDPRQYNLMTLRPE